MSWELPTKQSRGMVQKTKTFSDCVGGFLVGNLKVSTEQPDSGSI